MNKSNTNSKLSLEEVDLMYKELDLVQNNIKRMSSNSFLIKGWAVTLVIGSLLLRVTDLQLILPFIPVIAFWCLDTYFLYLERKFRDLYSWIVENRPKSRDQLFDMNLDRFKQEKRSKKTKEIICVFLSKNLFLFYFSILLVVILYIVLSLI